MYSFLYLQQNLSGFTQKKHYILLKNHITRIQTAIIRSQMNREATALARKTRLNSTSQVITYRKTKTYKSRHQRNHQILTTTRITKKLQKLQKHQKRRKKCPKNMKRTSACAAYLAAKPAKSATSSEVPRMPEKRPAETRVAGSVTMAISPSEVGKTRPWQKKKAAKHNARHKRVRMDAMAAALHRLQRIVECGCARVAGFG